MRNDEASEHSDQARSNSAVQRTDGVLPKVLLTARSLESLPPGTQPGSASQAPNAAPGVVIVEPATELGQHGLGIPQLGAVDVAAFEFSV